MVQRVLRIPKEWADKLATDPAMHAAANATLVAFDPWLAASRTPFFPEYTDHGPWHVNEVLDLAAALVARDAWAVLTPADAAVNLAAALLHDCAMHLQEDGFQDLVRRDTAYAPLPEFPGDEPWPTLWDAFLAEARRWDERKLLDVRGSPDPVHPPPDDRLRWTDLDRRLVGEFLRRHHPRLAHEIAVRGVPGPDRAKLTLREFNEDLCDLAGLVARSHGLPLRSMLDPLQERFHTTRTCRDAHPVFLMALLRVSDVLQIHASRSPAALHLVRRLRSPLSTAEHAAHACIKEVRHSESDDPEAIFVEARPPNADTYLKVRQWLRWAQAELDASWAVTGEVYGRFDELKRLGLSVRRVRSNLDDEAKFAKTAPYYPGPAKFDTAGPDVLRLLIGPLYGDHPQVGIRELLQNALDAVREAEVLRERRGGKLANEPQLVLPRDVGDAARDADVLISLETRDGADWIVVADRGVGMTAATVRDYFLRAGASFRRSDAWKKNFERDAPAPGHPEAALRSAVLRSGKFGVGALAAFLLGDEIRVETRHVDVPDGGGVAFITWLDAPNVELRRIYRAVGTTVVIRLREGVRELLEDGVGNDMWFTDSWDWYCLGTPRVKRVTDKSQEPLVQRFVNPGLASPVDTYRWRRVRSPGFAAIDWTFGGAPRLICNGLVIGSPENVKWGTGKVSFLSTLPGLPFYMPSISVFDPDGRLPLSLTRFDLSSPPPFIDEVTHDVATDFCAYALACPTGGQQTDVHRGGLLTYPGLLSPRSEHVGSGMPFEFVFTRHGFSYSSPRHLVQLGVRQVLLLVTRDAFGIVPSPATLCSRAEEAVCSVSASRYLSGEEDLPWRKPASVWSVLGAAVSSLLPSGQPCAGLRIWTPVDRGLNVNAMQEMLLGVSHDGSDSGRWLAPLNNSSFVYEHSTEMLEVGSVPTGESPIHRMARQESARDFGLVAEIYFGGEVCSDAVPMNAVERAWHAHIRSPVIPYDIPERRRVLAHAYESLRDYLAYYESQPEKPAAKAKSRRGASTAAGALKKPRPKR